MSSRGLLAVIFAPLMGCAGFSGPGDFRGPVLSSPSLNSSSGFYNGAGDPDFTWPVANLKLSRGFKGHGRPHHGLDLRGARGTKIYAAAPGVVIYAGSGFTGYGRLVIIEHGDEWATFYSHLDRIEARQGQNIQRGEVLGTMGDSGRATGVHLHFEIRKNRQPVDPQGYLRSLSTIAGSE